MLKKASNNIAKSVILRNFDFIKEGSIIIEFERKAYLVVCKERSSFQNFSEDLEPIIVFNAIMHSDFPIIELNIKFYKRSIYIDEISTLISTSNREEIRGLVRFFSESWSNLLIFAKEENELKSFKFESNSIKDLSLCLRGLQIDIEDIMKNT
jgi:hypothetical protein